LSCTPLHRDDSSDVLSKQNTRIDDAIWLTAPAAPVATQRNTIVSEQEQQSWIDSFWETAPAKLESTLPPSDEFRRSVSVSQVSHSRIRPQAVLTCADGYDAVPQLREDPGIQLPRTASRLPRRQGSVAPSPGRRNYNTPTPITSSASMPATTGKVSNGMRCGSRGQRSCQGVSRKSGLSNIINIHAAPAIGLYSNRGKYKYMKQPKPKMSPEEKVIPIPSLSVRRRETVWKQCMAKWASVDRLWQAKHRQAATKNKKDLSSLDSLSLFEEDHGFDLHDHELTRKPHAPAQHLGRTHVTAVPRVRSDAIEEAPPERFPSSPHLATPQVHHYKHRRRSEPLIDLRSMREPKLQTFKHRLNIDANSLMPEAEQFDENDGSCGSHSAYPVLTDCSQITSTDVADLLDRLPTPRNRQDAALALGLLPGFGPSDLRAAYVRAAKRWHPDRPSWVNASDAERCQATIVFRRARVAYDLLTPRERASSA